MSYLHLKDIIEASRCRVSLFSFMLVLYDCPVTALVLLCIILSFSFLAITKKMKHLVYSLNNVKSRNCITTYKIHGIKLD